MGLILDIQIRCLQNGMLISKFYEVVIINLFISWMTIFNC